MALFAGGTPSFPALSLPKNGRDEDGGTPLLPHRVQFPHGEGDDPPATPLPINFYTVAAGWRIYAVGQNTLAVIHKYLDTRAVHEHVQLDAGALLYLGGEASGKVLAERNLARAGPIHKNLAMDGVKAHQGLGLLTLRKRNPISPTCPGSNSASNS